MPPTLARFTAPNPLSPLRPARLRAPQHARFAPVRSHSPLSRLTLLALAVQLACAAVLLAAAPVPVHAQAAANVQADVPAGPLAEALNRFALQAGVAIVVDADKLTGKTTPGLKGAVTVEEGFRRLLAGSGYQIGRTQAGYVLVAAPPPSPPVAQSVPSQPLEEATLPAVKVSSTRFDTSLSDLPRSITLVEQADIDKQPGFQTNPVGALSKSVPGLQISQSVGGFPSIRGRSTSYRINGVEQNQLGRGTNITDVLLSGLGTRIEVVRGGDATYGFGASGGSVNFITAEPVPGPIQYETQVGTVFQPSRFRDSLSGLIDQSVTGSSGPLSFHLGGRVQTNRSRFDGAGDPLPDRASLNRNHDNYLLNAAFRFDLGNGQRLTSKHTLADVNEDVRFQSNFDGTETRKPTTRRVTDRGNRGSEQYIGTLNYENDQLFGNRFKSEFFYQTQKVAQQFSNAESPEDFLEDNGRIGLRLNVETPLASLKAFGADGATLVWGLDLQRYTYEQGSRNGPSAGFPTFPKITQDSTGPFAQVNLPLGADWLLTGGVRYQHTTVKLGSLTSRGGTVGNDFAGGDVSFGQALYNAGLIYFLSPSREVFFNFSQASDVLDFGRGSRQVSAAVQLNPQAATSDQYEFGFRQKDQAYSYSAAVFYTDSELGQSFVRPPASLPGSFAVPRREPRQIWGVELTADAVLTKRTRIGGTLSWSDGKREINGESIRLTATDTVPLKLFAYAEHDLQPGMTMRLQATHSVARGAERQDVTFEGPSRSFTVVDAAFLTKVSPGTLSFAIENLFNSRDVTPIDDVSRAFGNVFPIEGRTMVVSYRLRW